LATAAATCRSSTGSPGWRRRRSRIAADSRSEAARVGSRALLVSTETVLRWTRRGELPAIRLPGGAIRFREAEIEAWLQERATTERGSATDPAGRRPAATLSAATDPDHREED
jgi:excisionase family DNA binding protein